MPTATSHQQQQRFSTNTNLTRIATEEKSGWLQKWTNYLKGYRQRWFVLDSNAILSYYRLDFSIFLQNVYYFFLYFLILFFINFFINFIIFTNFIILMLLIYKFNFRVFL